MQLTYVYEYIAREGVRDSRRETRTQQHHHHHQKQRRVKKSMNPALQQYHNNLPTTNSKQKVSLSITMRRNTIKIGLVLFLAGGMIKKKDYSSIHTTCAFSVVSSSVGGTNHQRIHRPSTASISPAHVHSLYHQQDPPPGSKNSEELLGDHHHKNEEEPQQQQTAAKGTKISPVEAAIRKVNERRNPIFIIRPFHV
jgi:hypothetical protein